MATTKQKPGPKGPHKHPLLKKMPINMKLSQWVIDELHTLPAIAPVVEQAIIKALKIKPPKIE